MFDKHIQGVICEYLAAAWFTNNDYMVSWPFAHFGEYDFIITKEGEKPKRVQVKKVYFDNAKNRYISSLILSHKNCDGTTRNKKYNADSFDICAFVCVDCNVIYVVPISEIIGRRSITFYPDSDEPKISSQRPASYERFKRDLMEKWTTD